MIVLSNSEFSAFFAQAKGKSQHFQHNQELPIQAECPESKHSQKGNQNLKYVKSFKIQCNLFCGPIVSAQISSIHSLDSSLGRLVFYSWKTKWGAGEKYKLAVADFIVHPRTSSFCFADIRVFSPFAPISITVCPLFTHMIPRESNSKVFQISDIQISKWSVPCII